MLLRGQRVPAPAAGSDSPEFWQSCSKGKSARGRSLQGPNWVSLCSQGAQGEDQWLEWGCNRALECLTGLPSQDRSNDKPDSPGSVCQASFSSRKALCVDSCSLLLREELPVRDGCNITATESCLVSLAGDDPRKNHPQAFPAVPACCQHGAARC